MLAGVAMVPPLALYVGSNILHATTEGHAAYSMEHALGTGLMVSLIPVVTSGIGAFYRAKVGLAVGAIAGLLMMPFLNIDKSHTQSGDPQMGFDLTYAADFGVGLAIVFAAAATVALVARACTSSKKGETEVSATARTPLLDASSPDLEALPFPPEVTRY